jgi:hypothetical protein
MGDEILRQTVKNYFCPNSGKNSYEVLKFWLGLRGRLFSARIE